MKDEERRLGKNEILPRKLKNTSEPLNWSNDPDTDLKFLKSEPIQIEFVPYIDIVKLQIYTII